MKLSELRKMAREGGICRPPKPKPKPKSKPVPKAFRDFTPGDMVEATEPAAGERIRATVLETGFASDDFDADPDTVTRLYVLVDEVIRNGQSRWGSPSDDPDDEWKVWVPTKGAFVIEQVVPDDVAPVGTRPHFHGTDYGKTGKVVDHRDGTHSHETARGLSMPADNVVARHDHDHNEMLIGEPTWEDP